MASSLPERPDIEQLRRQAKELRDAARRGDAAAVQRFADRTAPITLAAAQLVIARELGFPSWPQLKAAVDAASHTPLRTFVSACGAGDVPLVRELLAADPSVAVAIDEERGWPALMYVCNSKSHQVDPDRGPALAEVVRMLLSAGANVNTNNGSLQQYRSALTGAVDVNNPDIVSVLLDAGAHPDPGQPIATAAGFRDHRCLKLLLAHGARVTRTWAIGAAVFADDPDAVALLADALESTGIGAARDAGDALGDAAAEASLPVITALLQAGANPDGNDPGDIPPIRRAVRAGRSEAADLLRAAGATAEIAAVDRFLSACLDADRETAERLLADNADLREHLDEQDRIVFIDAAGSRPAAAVGLMLELGFDVADRNGLGEQPLHSAAYRGNADVVQLLLDAGAEVDARDSRFDATPLAYATVGSREQDGEPGDWIRTVRLLIDAGASREGVWVTGKPPSADVAQLLQLYGIAPDAAPEDEADEHDTVEPESPGTDAAAEIGRQLVAVYSDGDLELFASLLHPEVRWGRGAQGCSGSNEVVDWYRRLQAEGVDSNVQSIAVDGDAVILELAPARHAEGARPAPAQLRYQIFLVRDAQIVEISGAPDQRTAFAHARRSREVTS